MEKNNKDCRDCCYCAFIPRKKDAQKRWGFFCVRGRKKKLCGEERGYGFFKCGIDARNFIHKI